MSVVATSVAEIGSAAAAVVGDSHVLRDAELIDASGIGGVTPLLALPGTAEQVRELVAWAYANDVAILPVGGRTGFSGGIAPLPERPTLALALDRLDRVRSFDPQHWRMEVDAGVTTQTVHRLAGAHGLQFPPDPGGAAQSQIGGNIATNAAGPHAFKYGPVNHWVTGVEAVIAPGELVRFGGPIRKDVAGYDLRGLLIGSEGTLGVVTGAWLRLTPAPAAAIPIVAGYGSVADGVAAISAVISSGVVPSALEYLQGSCLRHAPPTFIDASGIDFMVICEAESAEEAAALLGALGPAAGVYAADDVWPWRKGVSLVVRAVKGEKLAEDITVPLDRFAEAVERTLSIGAANGLEATSWGHAGDGNLHSTFLYDPHDPADLARLERAASDLFDLARELGGSVSGEHGLGLLKRGQLLGQWTEPAVAAHEAIKRALDPKGLFNPGKKVARPPAT